VNNSNTTIGIHFRFLSLDKFQAFTLAREIIGSFHKENVQSNTYVASVPLTKHTFEEINDYYVRQRVEINECDIHISVNSTTNVDSVEIPALVNHMLKYIDCKLTFSFTIV
jgi:hypothetical protein